MNPNVFTLKYKNTFTFSENEAINSPFESNAKFDKLVLCAIKE